MPSAIITINGTPGSDTDLPIGVLVQLDNQNTGGETTYKWTILDQPVGPADSLSSTTIQNPTLTTSKEGSYLLELIVNEGVGQLVDQQVAGILQLKTRERVPATGETIEADPVKGWSDNVVDPQLIALDTFRADPGSQTVVELGGASTVTAGDVVRFIGVATLKAGLPGEERILMVEKAPATAANVLGEPLGLVRIGVDGSDPVSIGGLLYVRWMGLVEAAIDGTPSVGDPVYVDDSAVLSATPGTNSRQVGKVINVVGVDGDVFYTGGLDAGTAGGGSSTYLALLDTPGSFATQGGRLCAVNLAENAVDFLDLTQVLDTDTLVLDPSLNSVFIGPGSVGNWPATTAVDTIGIGSGALALLTNADGNVCIGRLAGSEITEADQNVFIGRRAGEFLSGETEGSSSFNVAMGTNAMQGASTGRISISYNVAIGQYAMSNVGNVSQNNIAIGRNALNNIDGGDDNIAFGANVGIALTTGSNNILFRANAPAAGTSQYLSIADSFFGDLANDKYRIGGGAGVVVGDVSLRLAPADQAFMPNVVANTAAITTPEDGMMVYSIADNEHMFRQNGAWVAAGGAAAVRFFQKADLESTTTGTTPISKVQISTGAIAAGTYELRGTFTWRRSSTIGDAQFEVIRDVGGTPVVHWAQQIESTDGSSNQRNSSAFSDEFALGAGSYTFDIMFNNLAGSGGSTLGIQQARIWLVKVG